MSTVMIWEDSEDDCYEDDPTDYGCGIPGCDCMTYDIDGDDEEGED